MKASPRTIRTLVDRAPVLRVAPWTEGLSEPTLAVHSAYAEMYWLPILGPSALWMLRRLSRCGPAVRVDDLATELGLGEGSAVHAPVIRTLARLVHFHMVTVCPPDLLRVRLRLAPLPERFHAQLTPRLRAAHGRMLERAREQVSA